MAFKKKIIFDREKKIFIYGAGERGIQLYRKLCRNGFSVLGYIDKNKKLNREVRVYEVGEFLECIKLKKCEFEREKDEIVIIISLSNGMLHKEIAERLYGNGCENLVFLPLSGCIDDKISDTMFYLYNELISEDEKLTQGFWDLYKYENFREDISLKKNSVLLKSENSVVCWVDMEIVYSLDYENWPHDKSKITLKSEFYDKHISCLTHYHDLMIYFENGSGDPTRYLDSFGIDSSQKRSKKLYERQMAYQIYKKKLNEGMKYFIYSAPMAKYNLSGYYNLLDGHHRVMYLYTQGFDYIPLRMSHEDFLKWENKKEQKKLKRLIRSQSMMPFFKSGYVCSPLFYGKADKKPLPMLAMTSLIRCISKFRDNIQVFLDVSETCGYVSRHISRSIKCELYCISKFTKIVNALNALAEMKNINVLKNEETRGHLQLEFLERLRAQNKLIDAVFLPEQEDTIEVFERWIPIFYEARNFFFVVRVDILGEEFFQQATKKDFQYNQLAVYVENGIKKEMGLLKKR